MLIIITTTATRESKSYFVPISKSLLDYVDFLSTLQGIQQFGYSVYSEKSHLTVPCVRNKAILYHTIFNEILWKDIDPSTKVNIPEIYF